LAKVVSEKIDEVLVELGVSSVDERMPASFDETDYARPENRFLVKLGTNSRSRNGAGAWYYDAHPTLFGIVSLLRGLQGCMCVKGRPSQGIKLALTDTD